MICMENRCIACGDIIPEGRMICINCERRSEELESESNRKVKKGIKTRFLNFIGNKLHT